MRHEAAVVGAQVARLAIEGGTHAGGLGIAALQSLAQLPVHIKQRSACKVSNNSVVWQCLLQADTGEERVTYLT